MAMWLLEHPIPPPTAAAARVSTKAFETPKIENASALPGADYSQSLSRPLFSPTRKPFSPPLPPQAIAEPPPSAPVEVTAPPTIDTNLFKLKGVLLSEALDSALIATAEQPNGQWFTAGSDLQGWKLTKIEKDQVVLIQNGQTITLQLYVDNPQKPL